MSTKLRKLALSLGFIGLCIPSISQALIEYAPHVLVLTGATGILYGSITTKEQQEQMIQRVKNVGSAVASVPSKIASAGSSVVTEAINAADSTKLYLGNEWEQFTFGTRFGSATPSFDNVKKVLEDVYSNGRKVFSITANPEDRLKNIAVALLKIKNKLQLALKNLSADVDTALLEQRLQEINTITSDPKNTQLFVWANQHLDGTLATAAKNIENTARTIIALNAAQGTVNTVTGKPLTGAMQGAAGIQLFGAKGDASQAIANGVGDIVDFAMQTSKAVANKVTEKLAGPEAIKNQAEKTIDSMNRDELNALGDRIKAKALPLLEKGEEEIKNWVYMVRKVVTGAPTANPNSSTSNSNEDSLEDHSSNYDLASNNQMQQNPKDNSQESTTRKAKVSNWNSLAEKIASLNQATILKGVWLTMGGTVAAALIWRHRGSIARGITNGVTYIAQKTKSGVTIVYEVTCDGATRIKGFFVTPETSDEAHNDDRFDDTIHEIAA